MEEKTRQELLECHHDDGAILIISSQKGKRIYSSRGFVLSSHYNNFFMEDSVGKKLKEEMKME